MTSCMTYIKAALDGLDGFHFGLSHRTGLLWIQEIIKNIKVMAALQYMSGYRFYVTV